MLCGAYRCVFLLGNFAIKLPRITRLGKALRCSRWEREMWKVWRLTYGWEHLCPVYFSDPAGFMLVMYRAEQPVSVEDIERANSEEYDHYYPDIHVEYKPENWGKIGNKILCLDYGLAESECVKKRRAYLEERKNEFSVVK